MNSEIPQTAAQINAPQTGETVLAPPQTVGLAAKVPSPQKPKPAIPPSALPVPRSLGWSIANLRGTKPFVKDAITARADIEAHWRQCLCDAIDTDLLKPHNVVTVNAHLQIHDGKPVADQKITTPPILLLTLRIVPETVGGI